MIDWNSIKDTLPPELQALTFVALVVIAVIWGSIRFAKDIKEFFKPNGGTDNPEPSFGAIADKLKKGELEATDLDYLARLINEQLGNSIVEGEPVAPDPKVVAEAVSDIIEDNNPVSVNALTLIAEGKVEEGLQMLEQQANETSTESARQWCELGDILRNVSVSRAIAAYKKSLAVEPTQFYVDIELIRLYQMVGDLPSAATHLLVAENHISTNTQWGILFHEEGEVKSQQGDLPVALAAFENALTITKALSDASPDDPVQKRNLSVYLEKVGDIKQAQADLDGALTTFNDSLAIRQSLTAADPSNAGWQRDLSVSLEKVGDIKQVQGDLDGALTTFNDSLAIAQSLAAADPSNAGWQRDLSVSFNKVGEIKQAQGAIAEALMLYQQSLPIAEALAKMSPGHVQLQNDLAITRRRIEELREMDTDIPEVT